MIKMLRKHDKYINIKILSQKLTSKVINPFKISNL
jgi:hypothetical protein